MLIRWIIGGVLLAVAGALLLPGERRTPDEDVDEAAMQEETLSETETVRAVIRHAKHDMNPVTLQGWTRIICDCEDGAERAMSFDGDAGVYLTDGESGLLEHRGGVFVSFTKDSGEVVTPMYRMLPEEADGEPEEE